MPTFTMAPVNTLPVLTSLGTINGTEANDTLFGSSNADVIRGFGGNDTLDGGAGNDILIGGAGADRLIGGAGIDTASYSDAKIGVTVDLATGGLTNDAQGDTYIGIENLTGSNFGDILNGDALSNVIDGLSGDDFLFGQGGSDTIKGGIGNDVLRGGVGDDILMGGAGDDMLTGDDQFQLQPGRDQFVFAKGEGTDTIMDFQVGFDKIVLSGFGATPFGTDGILATGHSETHVGWLGTYTEYVFENVQSSDKVFWDRDTGTLKEVAPTLINGHVASLNTVADIGIVHTDNGLHTSDFLVT